MIKYEPNPMLLFELRQIVRNRSVLVLLVLYLAAMALLAGWVLVFPSNFEALAKGGLSNLFRYYPETPARLTLLLFLTYYSFTTITLVGYAAVRTATDRLRENPAYDTPLPPRRLVMGKLLFGVTVSLLFLSATFPFLAVVYLMRGLDVRLLFWFAFFLFCMTQLQYFVTVALFSGAKTPARIAAMLLPALFIQFFMAFFTVTQVPEFVYHLSMNIWDDPVATFVILSLIEAVPMLILFLVCCVQFSPETSNRMMPVRVTLTVIQILLSLFLLGVAVHGFLSGQTDYDGYYRFAVVLNLPYWFSFPYLFAVFICERENWSPRIRRAIPRTFARRLLVFPFFTGASNAMVWSLLSLLLIAPLPVIVYFATGGSFPEGFTAGIFGGFSFGLLFFDYCATALLLYNLVFHRWISRQWNWLPLFLLLAVPVLGIFFLSAVTGLVAGVTFRPENAPFLPLPWFQESPDFVWIQWIVAVLWTAVLGVIGRPWIRRRFLEFHPDEPPSDTAQYAF